jgi:hypothetical protein
MYSKEHYGVECFGNWDCFHPHLMGWETPTLLNPSEKTNINDCTTHINITRAI